MRALLRGSMGRSLKMLDAEDRLTAAWTVACGKVLAGRGTIVGFEDEVLRIEVGETAWLQQMYGMRAQLALEVSRISGVKVRAIDLEVPGARRAQEHAAVVSPWRKRSGERRSR